MKSWQLPLLSLLCLVACQQPKQAGSHAYEHFQQWSYCNSQHFASELARVECEETHCKPIELEWMPAKRERTLRIYELRKKYAKRVDAGKMTRKEAEDALVRDQKNNYRTAAITTSHSAHDALRVR